MADKRVDGLIRARPWVAAAQARHPRGYIVQLGEGYTFYDLTTCRTFENRMVALRSTRRQDVIRPDMLYVEAAYTDGWLCARTSSAGEFEKLTPVANYTEALQLCKDKLHINCSKKEILK